MGKFWGRVKELPTIYDGSLSIYEIINKILYYLHHHVTSDEEMKEAVNRVNGCTVIDVAHELGYGSYVEPADLNKLDIKDGTALYFRDGIFCVKGLEISDVKNVTVLMGEAKVHYTTDSFIYATNCENFRVEGGVVDGDGSQANGLRFDDCKNVIVEGVTVQNIGGVNSVDTSGIKLLGDCTGFRVSNCVVKQVSSGRVYTDGFIHAYGIQVNRRASTLAYSRTGTIELCTISGIAGIDGETIADGDGIFIQAPPVKISGVTVYPESKINVHQCFFSECKKRGVKVAACGVEIRGCIFEGDFYYACIDMQYGHGTILGCQVVNTSSYNSSVTSAIVASDGGVRVEQCYVSAPYELVDATSGEVTKHYHPGIRFTNRLSGSVVGNEEPWDEIFIKDCRFEGCSRAVYANNTNGVNYGYTLTGIYIEGCRFGHCEIAHEVELYNTVFAVVGSFKFTDFLYDAGVTRSAVKGDNPYFVYPYWSDCTFTDSFELYSRHWDDDPMSGWDNLPSASHMKIVYNGSHNDKIMYKEYTDHGSLIVGTVDPNAITTGTLARQLLYNSRIGDVYLNRASGVFYVCKVAGTTDTIGTWESGGSGGNGGSGATDEQIRAAVEAYMVNNPVSGGDGLSIYYTDSVLAEGGSSFTYVVYPESVETYGREMKAGDLIVSSSGRMGRITGPVTSNGRSGYLVTTFYDIYGEIEQRMPEISLSLFNQSNVPIEGNDGRGGVSISVSYTDKDGTLQTSYAPVYNGYTPKKGTDYFTDAEIEEVAALAASKVGGEIGEPIPDYIADEIERVRTALKGIQDAHPKSATFAFLTDHHYHSNSEHLVRHNLNAIDSLSKDCHVEFAAFGGDNLAEYGDGAAALNKVKTFGNILRDYNVRKCVVMGNHDDNSLSGYQADTGKYLFDYAVPQSQFYAHMYRDNENVFNISMDKNRDKLYFYVDLPSQQIRVIFLNVIDIPLQDDGSGNLVYAGIHDSGYSDEQLNWVVKDALNFSDKKNPEQWGVITVQHFTDCPEIAAFSNDSYVDRGHGGEVMYNIFKAFRARTTYSHVTFGDFGHYVNCDFTDAKAELICRISGHTHKDWHVMHDGVLYISTMAAGLNGVGVNQGLDGVTYEKVPDTAEESAFDFLTIDKGSKTIFATRFGVGVDRVISWAVQETETLDTVRIVFQQKYNGGSGAYVDDTTFEYTETDTFASYGPTLAKQSTLAGGLLRVNWDANKARSFGLNIYLFDADGAPYKWAGWLASADAELWSGENYEPVWGDPGDYKSWGWAVAPFSVQIPEGCTCMCAVRYTADALSPDGSLSGAEDFQNWVLNGGLTFTVTK